MSEQLSKKAKLAAARKIVEKYLKKNPGANVTVGDPDFGKIEVIQSGVWKLDRLTHGFPRGKYTHIAGPSKVGKSTFAFNLIGEMQANGLVCALGNNERRFSPDWAQQNGVNMKELLGGNFQDLEQCLDFCIDMASNPGICDCIVIDTITALASRGEIMDKKGERSTGDNTMAQIPRKLSQFFRMATARIADSGMVVILINQVRKDLGSIIVKDISVGGNALEHAKTLDIFLRRTAKKDWPMDEEGKPIGHKINAMLLKCSHTMQAEEGQTTEINFFRGKGFNNAYDIAQEARQKGIITTTGQNFEYIPTTGEPVKMRSAMAAVDSRMSEELVKLGFLNEVREKVESFKLDKIDVTEKIDLDPEAEAEEKDDD